LRIIFFRIFKIFAIKKYIPLEKYDFLILRYPLVDGIGSIKFSKDYGHKIYTEHHTDEISELYSVGRFFDIVRMWIEKAYSGTFLSNVKGIIGVTEEITKLQLKKINKEIISTTIANGINPQSFKTASFKDFDGKNLCLIFVASCFSPWHGLEVFLKLLIDYKSDVKITLRLVGKLSASQEKYIKKINKRNLRVEIFGRLELSALDAAFEDINLAISSLAISSKNMTEACTLKTREDIARGIPFIYAYKDTDLKGDENFAKRFKENNICIDEIIAFAKFVTSNRNKVEEEMLIYRDIVSWKTKLEQMMKFVENNK